MSEARDFVFPLLSKNRTVQALTIAAASIFSPFAGAALSMWYGQRNARDAKRRARSQYLAGLTGRSQMFRSPVANRQVIYGRAKVSGPVLFVGTTGVAAENLYMVIALAGHEIQGFDTVWFNEEPLGLDAGGNVVAGKYFRGRTEAWDLPMGNTAGSTLTVPSTTNLQLWQEDPAPENGARTQPLILGTHYTVAGNVVTLTAPLFVGQPIRASGTRFVGTSLANVRVYTGTDTQTADAELMAQFPTQWTSAHRLRGVAYAIVRLSYDPNVFQGGVPNIAFTVFGKKVFDPRSSTTTYSNNWALCVHDYLRSAEGGNFSAAEIDTASIIAAANVSDELVPLAAGGSQPRYTLDGAFELATSPEELLPDMLTAGNGSAIYQQGKWTLKAGAYTAPVLALNENDLAGGVSIVPEVSAFDLFNAVKGTFIDPQRSWQPSEFPLVANALYETADGGERKELDLTLLYTQDATRAQRIAKQLLDRSRLALTCTAEFNLKAFRLQAGDTITLSIARYGWVNKIFMVRQREFNFATQRVTLTLQEEAAAAYNWAGGDALAYDPAPNTTLPQPWNIPAPASAAATSGNNTLVRLDDGTIVPQIQVTWTQPTNIYVLRNGRTEVEYRRVVDAAWRRIEVRGDAAAAFLPDVQEASAYSIRLRHVLDNGTTSDWTILSPHTVVGKSAPPPDATSLSVTTLPSGRRRFTIGLPALPIDIDGAQIRFNSGASLGPWLSAARLGQNVRLVAGSAAGSEVVDLDAPGPGQWTFGVRLVDGSGNLSANTITTTVTLGALPAAPVEPGGNVLRNPLWFNRTDGWFATPILGATLNYNPITAGFFDIYGLQGVEGLQGCAIHLGATPPDGSFIALESQNYPVAGGSRWQFSVRCNQHRSNVFVRMVFFDASLNVLLITPTPGTMSQATAFTDGTWARGVGASDDGNGGNPNRYTRLYVTATAPAGAAYVRADIYTYKPNGVNAPYLFACQAMLCEVSAGTVDPVPFSAGPGIWQGAGALSGSNVTNYVNPNTINTREINPGAVTVVSDTKPSNVTLNNVTDNFTATANIATLSYANTSGETQQVLVNYYALHDALAGIVGGSSGTTTCSSAIRVSGVTYTGQPSEFLELAKGSTSPPTGSVQEVLPHGGSFVVSVANGQTMTVNYEIKIVNSGVFFASSITSKGISMSLAVLKR